MQPLDFQNPTYAPPSINWLARAKAGLDRLDAQGGFTPSQHLAIIEGLFRGVSLQDIAAKMRKPFHEVQERFFAMRRPVSITSNGRVNMPIDAQTALLRACRERVN